MSVNAVGRDIQNPYVSKAEDSRKQQPGAVPEANEQRREPKDEYIPSGEKPKDGSKSYRLLEDEKGYKRIVESEDEKKSEDEKESAPAENDEKKTDGGATVNTDKVDREIERLKEKRTQLEQQLNSVRDDEVKRKDIERQLAQATSELSSKDNDAYRKANAVVTEF